MRVCVGRPVHSHTLKKQGRCLFGLPGTWPLVQPVTRQDTSKEGEHLAEMELALPQGCRLLAHPTGGESLCKHRDMQLLVTPAELRLMSRVA